MNDIVRVLASDLSTRWRAFELLFAAHFRHQCSMRVEVCGLKGNPLGTSELSIVVQSDQVIDQNDNGSIPSRHLDENGRLKPASIVVCRRGFPVIDFFVYANDGKKYFVQLSESNYENHSSHLPDLFKTRTINGEETSIFKYFANLTGAKFRANKPSKLCVGNMPDGYYYLYVTTKSAEQARYTGRQYSHPDVLIVNGNACKKIGASWNVPGLYDF